MCVCVCVQVAAAEEKAKAAEEAVSGSAAAEQTAKLEEMKRALARAVKRNKTEKDAAAQREAGLVEQVSARIVSPSPTPTVFLLRRVLRTL